MTFDPEARARELMNQLIAIGPLRPTDPGITPLFAAALTEAREAGAEPYAREALLVLSEAGIPTPERGYVADGGAGLMGGDLRKLAELLNSAEARLARAHTIIRDYRTHYGTDHRDPVLARSLDERAAGWLRDADERR